MKKYTVSYDTSFPLDITSDTGDEIYTLMSLGELQAGEIDDDLLAAIINSENK